MSLHFHSFVEHTELLFSKNRTLLFGISLDVPTFQDQKKHFEFEY